MQVVVAVVIAVVVVGAVAGAALRLRSTRFAAGDGRTTIEAQLRRMSRHVVAVDFRVTPAPCATLTLKKGGRDAQATFHAYCRDVARLLTKIVRTRPGGAMPALVFRLHVDVMVSDGDGARRIQDTLVLEMAIAADAAGHVPADEARPAVSALLRHAQIRFHDPIGREMVRAFCGCERYQGVNGASPSSTFCARALQP